VAKKQTQTAQKGSPDVKPDTAARVIYYDELHFIPTKDKDTYWAAQVLYFNKMVYEPFVEPREAKFYRDLEVGIIDEKLYREFIDPKTPDGKGGKAEYFKANWQTCPIYMHLENIKESQLKKLPFNFVCKASDEFSKLKQQIDNDKIIGAKYLRSFLNEINPQFGIRALRPDEDPFAFINQISQQAQNSSQQQQSQPSPATSNPTSAIEAIKAKIFDNDTLSIYNQYLYKDGVEVAFEIGIDTYINSINKFKQSIYPRIIEDVKNFNAHVYRHYTSTTTGRPVIEYKDPAQLRISRFKKPDMSDYTGVIEEFDISFGEFVQMAGGDLKPEMLKEIFIKNRQFHGVMGDYNNLTTFQRNSAKIRIGYHEFETQNMDVYAEYVNKQGNKRFVKQNDQNYQPSEYAKSNYNAKRVEKHYNVWYSFYYIPLDTLYTISGTTSFQDQSKYIFQFGPIQDQVREGDDMRYAKGTFVGGRSKRFSFAKIEHSFMPEIVKLWQLFQNDISSSMSDGVIWAEEVINNMMKYVDSGGSPDTPQGKRKKQMEAIKIIRQTNSAIANFSDDGGEPGEGGRQRKLFEKVQLNSLATAAERLQLIMSLYKLLTQSLGFNEIAEGQSPEPRQNLGGINLAMMASSNALYQMEEQLINSRLNLGERIMYYIKEVVDEGENSDRFQEFRDMVGQANAMAAQSIKDIPLHRMNLHLEDQMTDTLKAAIIQTANEMAKAQIISPDQVLFLMMVENVKYAYAILAIEIRAGQKALSDSQQAARMQTRSDQLFTSGLKIREMHAQHADDAAVDKMLGDLKTQQIVIDNQLKTRGQLITKDQINNHRIQQAIIENRLQQQSLQSTQNLENHAAKVA